MSGGSYDYAYRHLEDFAEALRLRTPGQCYAASPALRMAFAEHCEMVAIAMKAVEWNDSGDGDSDETRLIEAVVAPANIDATAVRRIRKTAQAMRDSGNALLEALADTTVAQSGAYTAVQDEKTTQEAFEGGKGL